MIFVNKEDGSYENVRKDSNLFTQVVDLYKKTFHDSDSFTRVIMEKVKAVSIDIENDKVVAIALYREKRIFENGKTKKVPFIFGVATHKEYRKQKKAHKIMNGMLNYLTQKGYDRALLAPANEKLYEFYSEFGFERYSFFKYRQGNIDNKYSFVEATRKDINIMTRLFNNNARRLKSCQYRTNADTSLKIKEIVADEGQVMLAIKDGKVVGYYLEDEEIIESIGIDWKYNKSGKTIVFPSKEYEDTDKCPGIVMKKINNTLEKSSDAYFYDRW